MGTQPIRRGVVVFLAAVAIMAAASAASADTVTAETDSVHPVVAGVVPLGMVDPGAVVHVDVVFRLDCAGFLHVDPDQWVVLGLGSNTVPEDGSVFATDVSIPPPGTAWPVDGDACGSNQLSMLSAAATVTVTAPTVPGQGYLYSLMWTRDLWPETDNDTGTFTGAAAITLSLDVRGNAAPVLNLPGDLTLEGDTTGGAHGAYTVGATDNEDGATLTPVCAPAVGTVLPLGNTTVNCAVTDSGGRTDSGSFQVTVVDTGKPTLAGVPSAFDLTTTSAIGAELSYARPTATDIVDAMPSVSCNPPSGSIAPIGDSNVVCTANDLSGNTASVTIPVHVTLVTPPPTPTPTPTPAPTPTPTPAPTPTPTPAPTPTPTPTPAPTPTPTPAPTPTPTPAPTPTPDSTPPAPLSAAWEQPIGGTPPQLSANSSRSVPVKVRLYRDGDEITSGSPILRVTPCGATEPVYEFELTWNGRWVGKLDTSNFAGRCYRVAAVVDGIEAGFFRLDQPGAAPSKTPGAVKAPATKPAKTTP